MKNIYILVIFFFQITIGQTGYEIAKQMDEKKDPRDMSADLTMVLTNSKGKTRTSTLRSVSFNGGAKQIIWFLAPADDKGVSFLKIEHPDRDDEMRLWLPAFKKVRRISAKKKGESFMGSDLSYEDMTNRNLDENEYLLLGSEDVNGRDCYKLEITPKPEAKSTYSKHITWIWKKNLTPVKEESFDQVGKLLKKKNFVFKEIKSYDTPLEIYVEDVQKNHNTRVTFENIILDSGVKEDLFQEKNLKRLPR